jgi:hypothetical protein
LDVRQPVFLNSPKILSSRPSVRSAQLPFVGITRAIFALLNHRSQPLL